MITRATLVASAAAVMAAIMAAVFWQQLHKERLRSAQLQDRVTQLELRPLSAPALAPQAVPAPMQVQRHNRIRNRGPVACRAAACSG